MTAPKTLGQALRAYRETKDSLDRAIDSNDYAKIAASALAVTETAEMVAVMANRMAVVNSEQASG